MRIYRNENREFKGKNGIISINRGMFETRNMAMAACEKSDSEMKRIAVKTEERIMKELSGNERKILEKKIRNERLDEKERQTYEKTRNKILKETITEAEKEGMRYYNDMEDVEFKEIQTKKDGTEKNFVYITRIEYRHQNSKPETRNLFVNKTLEDADTMARKFMRTTREMYGCVWKGEVEEDWRKGRIEIRNTSGDYDRLITEQIKLN